MPRPPHTLAWLAVAASLVPVGAIALAESPSGAPASEDERLSVAHSFRITELGNDAVVVTSEPYAANSLLVRTSDGTIVLVDSPMTPADTSGLLEWVVARWGALPSHAITSHWHHDASAGNQVLVERGVEVISTRKTAELVTRRGDSARESLVEHFREGAPDVAEKMRAYVPTPATRVVVVESSLDLTLGGERVRLVYPGPSHSDDSIGIFFPERGILYGGCTVRSDGRIVNRREADAESWTRALETFAALEPGLVVPGHGARFDREMIGESIEAARALAADE